MARAETIRVVQTDQHEHPAVRAWHKLQSRSVEPVRIEILKGKEPKRTKKFKRIVCRLVGVGPSGSAVIAKRCRRANALIENTIYEDILPHLPIPALNYYGMLEVADGEFCWLFLEDASGQEISTLDGEHREIIVQWLSLMHISATQFAAPANLPSKGPNQYLKHLQLVRDAIRENLANLPLQADDMSTWETILHQIDILESHWDQVEGFCEGSIQTLVHGDFVERNLRVRSVQSRMTLLPFDWGEAGWGTPAVDVMQVDETRYWSFVCGHWPSLDFYAIQRLAAAGRIFRCLDALYWELPSFRYKQWLTYTMHNMRTYKERLLDAVRTAGLIYPVGSK